MERNWQLKYIWVLLKTFICEQGQNTAFDLRNLRPLLLFQQPAPYTFLPYLHLGITLYQGLNLSWQYLLFVHVKPQCSATILPSGKNVLLFWCCFVQSATKVNISSCRHWQTRSSCARSIEITRLWLWGWTKAVQQRDSAPCLATPPRPPLNPTDATLMDILVRAGRTKSIISFLVPFTLHLSKEAFTQLVMSMAGCKKRTLNYLLPGWPGNHFSSIGWSLKAFETQYSPKQQLIVYEMTYIRENDFCYLDGGAKL